MAGDEVDTDHPVDAIDRLPVDHLDDATAEASTPGDGRADDGARQPGGAAGGLPGKRRQFVKGPARGALLWMYGSVANAEQALKLRTHALANGDPAGYRAAMAHLEALKRERDLGLGAAIAAMQALRSVERLLPEVAGAEQAREQLALSVARLVSRYIEPLKSLE